MEVHNTGKVRKEIAMNPWYTKLVIKYMYTFFCLFIHSIYIYIYIYSALLFFEGQLITLIDWVDEAEAFPFIDNMGFLTAENLL